MTATPTTRSWSRRGPATARLWERGNVNNDSSVDISDGVGVLIYLFLSDGGESTCLDALDADDTGTIELTDAIYIFNFLFLGGPIIPDPYPVAGTDPTLDALPLCDWPD